MLTEKKLDRILSAASVVCVTLCAAPFVFVTASYSMIFDPVILSVMISFLGIFAGYFIQALASRILQRKKIYREAGEFAVANFFDKNLVVVPWIVYFILSYILMRVYYRYMLVSHPLEFDRFSASPIFIAITLFAVMAVGGFIWFYPPSMILSRNRIKLYLVLFSISCILFPLTSGKAPFFPAVCFILFLIIYALFSTQNSLNEAYMQSGISVSNRNARLYNLAVSALAILAFIAVAALTFGLLGLIRTGVLNLLRSALSRSVDAGDNTDITDAEYMIDPDTGYSGSDLVQFRSTVPSMIIMIVIRVVIPLIFIAAIIFIFTRKSVYKRILAFFAGILNDLYEFLRSLSIFLSLKRKNYDEAVNKNLPASYYDIETSVETSDLIETIDSFDDYRNISSRIKTESGKFTFAYAVMVRLIRKGKYNIRPSDTPRMINTKLGGSDIEKDCGLDTGRVTERYEDIEYACRISDNGELILLRNDMETVIKRLIYSQCK